MGVPTKLAKNDKKPIKRPSGYDEYIKQGAKQGFQDDPTNPLRKKVKEQGVAETELDEAKVKRTVEDIFHKGKKVGSITTTTTKGGITFYTAQVGNSFVAGPDTREEALKHLKRLYRDSQKEQGVAEGSYDYVKRGKELDAATKRVQSNLDRRIRGKELDAATKSRIRGKELDAATKRVQSNLDRRIKKLDQGVAEGSRDRRDPYDRGYHDGQRMGSNSYHNPYSREDEPTEWDEYKSGFNMAQIELQNDLEDNGFSEGVAEGEYKSRHIHQQEQNKKYDEYRRNQEAAGKKPLSRGDWAATQRKGQQGVAEAGNKPVEKSYFGMGDTRTPRDIKSQMRGASDRFVQSTADKDTGPIHSRVAKMQTKMAKSELRKRSDHDRMATGTNEGVAEGSAFDKWADDRAASQLYKLKPATTWEVSFDYGPHQSETVKVKARSAQEAVDKVETAAEKKGRSIMVNWARPAEQDIEEEKQRLDPSCWKGYKKQGTKMKGDTRVNNCVPVSESSSSILEGLQQVDEINWKHAAAAGAMALGALGGAGQAQAQFNPAGLSTVYLQQVAAGEHQRPMVSVDAAKAELQARADGKQQKVSSQSDTSSKPFTPVDYQTKEPLKKGADGKWYNSNGEERDGLHGGPMSSQGTAMFRSLKPRQ
jgi:hypothetical protein